MDISSIQLHVSSPEKYPGTTRHYPGALRTQADHNPAKQHAQRVASKLDVSDGLIYLLGQYALNIEDRLITC